MSKGARPGPIDAVLIAGGPYHDMDFARLELLKLLAEHERVRVKVLPDYADIEAISRADALLTYTCNVVPQGDEIDGLETFLSRGKRWFALHGTNSILAFVDGDKVDSPPLDPEFRAMVGSQFIAHPPIGRYKVSVSAPAHPLMQGVGNFFVEDEHYLMDYEPGNEVLLSTRFAGRTDIFVRDNWEDREHQVMYLRKHGGGEICYLALGHARGRYDMRPLSQTYPFVERGAWQLPLYYELLRRGIRWSLDTV